MALLTRQQAAERLSVNLRTLDGMIRRGSLPAYRIGARLVRIDEEALDAYLSGHLVAPRKQAEPPRPCRYVPGMKVV